jgi:hypothetical protein
MLTMAPAMAFDLRCNAAWLARRWRGGKAGLARGVFLANAVAMLPLAPGKSLGIGLYGRT